MGFEDFKKKRKERLDDPEIRKAHEEEWDRVKESFGHMGSQAKVTAIGIIYHSISFVGKGLLAVATAGLGHADKGKHGAEKDKKDKEGKDKHKVTHAETLGWKAIEHGVDGVTEVAKLVGRILHFAYRTGKYSVRKGIAI